MSYMYDNNELVDMLLLYGECHQDAEAARTLYEIMFPKRQLPPVSLFTSTVKCLRETGDLKPPSPEASDDETEEENLDLAKEDPELNFMLPKECFSIRAEYCVWLLEKFSEDKDFSRHILYTDEVSFTNNGIRKFNDPGSIASDEPAFYVNVWAGILDNTIIGPVILPDNLDSTNFLKFLQNNLESSLEDVPLKVRQNMWFLHSGEYPYFRSNVQKFLNKEFPERWISTEGPVLFPPHSPDLNPVNFYFWKYLENLVYAEEVPNLKKLKDTVMGCANFIQEKPLDHISDSLTRRAFLCIEMDGGSFHYLL